MDVLTNVKRPARYLAQNCSLKCSQCLSQCLSLKAPTGVCKLQNAPQIANRILALLNCSPNDRWQNETIHFHDVHTINLRCTNREREREMMPICERIDVLIVVNWYHQLVSESSSCKQRFLTSGLVIGCWVNDVDNSVTSKTADSSLSLGISCYLFHQSCIKLSSTRNASLARI